MSKKHYVLKRPQYENCQVLSPEGQLMFRCCQKKANWYLKKNLGRKVLENPLTVQLTFVPKGVGHINDPYFLQVMENRCVVCGSEEDLTRHHIVPYCYRKFFPTVLKEHKSYDVVATCIDCHRLYEDYASELKKVFANKYSAPVSGAGLKYNRELAAARGAAYAIQQNGDLIPPERRKLLLDKIEKYLHKIPTEEDFQILINENPYDSGSYVHHGKIVMDQITDIEQFVQEWRLHFIDKMQPKFLPAYWTHARPVCQK
jgi:exonuclease 3'-5' domain-containing protein 2